MVTAEPTVQAMKGVSAHVGGASGESERVPSIPSGSVVSECQG